LSDLLNTFLLVYAGLFPIVNPVGSAPIFLGLTRDATTPERHHLARGVAVNSFLLLLGSLFVGSHVLVFFGITLPVVRVAGGLVVSAFAWKLLQAGDGQPEARRIDPGHELKADATASAHAAALDSFYPLTMPLTVGPGSISVAIALGSQRPKEAGDLVEIALLGGAAVVGLAAIALTVYLCYRYAERIVAALGERGTNVLVRLSAFILLCIGVQIVWNGVGALLATGAR